ncbi:MAG: penicillin-binding protein 2 [Pseudomonadota bacterium]
MLSVRGDSLKDSDHERQLYTVRAVALFFFAVVGVVVLLARLVQLQVWEYETYSVKSDENRIQLQPIPPQRGLIFDRNGVLLAENRPVFAVNVVAERVTNLDGLLAELGRVVTVSADDISAFYERLGRKLRPYEPVPLLLDVSEGDVARLSVNRHRLPGVEIGTRMVRHYPYGELFSHAVGSVRRITEEDLAVLDPASYSATAFVGKRGVEQFYERSLHGEVGRELVEIDARGRIRQVLRTHPPTAGSNVTLQLDSRLQIAAHAALGERRGAIVAIDPRSGGLLAMVSNPSYDPNLFISGIDTQQFRDLSTARDTPLFNRATHGQYAPGSTFKPIVALAALASRATSWGETIEDKGFFKLPGQERIYRDWSWRKNDSGGQGRVDLRRAIYRSSNVYFYDLSTRMEIETLTGFAASFGFGANLAVDIADARPGLLPTPVWKQGYKGETWFPGDTVNMSIGQGDLLVTPLQLATVASIIASRGVKVRPRMLLSSDKPLDEFDGEAQAEYIGGPSHYDWEALVDAMEDVVHRGNKGFQQSGTAFAYIGRDIGYRMAGKSGTAQVVEIRQGEEYSEEELTEYQRKHAWFIAFAPADAPRIALSVLVENGGGGSSVAAPVAKEVIDAYLLPRLAAR